MKTNIIHKLACLGAGLLLTTACSDTFRLSEPDMGQYVTDAEIEFNNYVTGMTRASKYGATPFKSGESMGVWGYQTTGEIIDTIFKNQEIINVSGNVWTYDNKKLWNIGSTYKFYGVFPYSTTLYSIDDENKVTFEDYVNPSDTASQVDLMISEMRPVSPFNTVDMIFHHIMSNVNLYVKISNNLDITGISSINLSKLHISGIKNKGTYQQTGWTDEYAPVGVWSSQSGLMNIPDATDINLNMDRSATPVMKDVIMLPQQLFSAEGAADDVTIDAVFRIRYSDGTTSTFNKKGVRLAGITGKLVADNDSTLKISSWDINHRYNYTLAFNPSFTTRIWEADGDGSLIIDPVKGDTLSKVDDTPTPGTMKYDPENPDVIYVLEDTATVDGPKIVWVEYPIVWEDIDGDDLLEAGIDRDGDGHIDNVDGDYDTNQPGDDHKDPSDGDTDNNPDGKDCILVKIDTDDDGVPDTWVQLEKDPETGIITPERDTNDSFIEFTATVQDWDDNRSFDIETEM